MEMDLNFQTKGDMPMKRVGYLFVTVLTASFLLAGCATQLSQADRDLLNQAKAASASADQSAQAAADSAARAEKAAQRAEAAAGRAEQSAAAAAASATQAGQSAVEAKKAFEMTLKK